MTDGDASRDAVVIERSFDAPADLVWQMWTEPEHFKAWYGPTGATVPVAKMDVCVGGIRLVCMKMETPGGPMQMWFTGEYREVVENKRLVHRVHVRRGRPRVVALGYGHARGQSHNDRGHGGARGRRWSHEDGDDPCWYSRRIPGAAGWEMALDKLAAYLEGQSRR